ncbi:MAG: hybrid sensor histidine kinase/response regulator [Bacteriovoracaceae bacterium]|nr:hybrid sensor histidine kinase/response regulator [Bacteroidota bacterium]
MTNKKQTILLVDDEESLLDIVGSVLEAENFIVQLAGSVDKAIEHLNVATPDIIISDITMPGRNGFDFFAYVRSLPHLQHVPFLFLSAHSDSESVVAGKEMGSDDYLTKPVDFHLLLSSIRGKLKRKEQLSEAATYHVDKMKNEIFRLITHEMRTPLTSILGATELLSDSQSSYSQKELTEFLHMLQNSSKRLNAMVDDFLTATKIESGEIAREMEVKEYRITPFHVINRLIIDLEYQTHHHQVTIENRIPDITISVYMFASHLENILRRLIDNALKFSKPGSVIIIGMHEHNGYVFSVQDFGLGVPEDKRSILFQKFGQVDREKNEQQGSGLGLYIAHNLAKINGGDLWFESQEDKGSTFYVRVPKPR